MKPARRFWPWLASMVASLALTQAASCFSGNAGGNPAGGGGGGGGGDAAADGSGDDGGMSYPFYPDTAAVYVAKVKNVLVGLPPTDAEVKAVEADASKFPGLVDTWMTSTTGPCAPATSSGDTCALLYQNKMLRFFELAFQQTQIAAGDFNNMLQPGALQLDPNASTQALMVQNEQEVFARTMFQNSASNLPFTNAMITTSYMMTTAMRVFYALTDAWQLDNDVQGEHDYFAQKNMTVTVTAKTPLPANDATHLYFYDPKTPMAGCDPYVYAAPARGNDLYGVIVGSLAKTGNCAGGSVTGQLTPADFADWQMVDILPASMHGGATSDFWDLPSLRKASTLYMNRPYVGYFTTPAFFANWQTNISNQMRVTINQTLIVATGAQVDGTDTTVPMVMPPPGLDSAHAKDVACVTCHQTLDPTKSILSATYSFYYGQQIDMPKKDEPTDGTTYASQKGMFVFQGAQNKNINTIYDFAKALAAHPLVAPGWVQKLCYYVDSEPCDTSDPEFQRLAMQFQSGGFNWNDLVKAVVTSPITTHVSTTMTATTNGEVTAVARRDHLCAALNARLGFGDICGLDATKSNVLPSNALAIVPGLPSDGYGRGSTAPVLPNDPSLFYRAGTENFCEALSTVVVDNKNPPAGATTWSSSQCKSGASCAPIDDFVAIVAGIPPSDPRSTPLRQALGANFDQSLALKTDPVTNMPITINATEALQSTFMAACMAPSAIAIGL